MSIETRIEVQVEGELPASGTLADWISAIYANALDPQQRYKVRQALREKQERRKLSDSAKC